RIATMLGSRVPHAVLLAGPGSVGKTTLALDLAAGLLCQATDRAVRPCRACRACRLLDAGNHPDLHRLAPEGPGRQIQIDSIRRLVSALALLPLEGEARVAIIESAHRMNEDAQNALLKTLEEPPDGVTIVLCADEDERLLPTVRSRCARIRLGPVGPREVEALLAEHGAADAPTAARLARLAAGRPGLALAYALAPDAITTRGEIARSLLDLLREPPARRLEVIRDLTASANRLAVSLAPAENAATVGAPAMRGRAGRQAGRPARASLAEEARPADEIEPPVDGGETGVGDRPGRAAPAERRRAALMLLAVWADLARDLAVVIHRHERSLRDPALLGELESIAPLVSETALATFLARLEETSTLIDGNANPELALDVLALAWPRARRAA
ncbi:MAG TPA: DNA polymerase III subunit delta', partial [Candidatus Limnocylindrales bacterium]